MTSHLCANARAWKRNEKKRAGRTGGGGTLYSNDEMARCKVRQRVVWESRFDTDNTEGNGWIYVSQDA